MRTEQEIREQLADARRGEFEKILSAQYDRAGLPRVKLALLDALCKDCFVTCFEWVLGEDSGTGQK